VVVLLNLASLCTAFKVTKYSQVPEKQDLRTGESLYLLCKSDTNWERCKFSHKPLGGNRVDQFCSQEWKRASGSVQFTSCPMKSRVRKVGNYNRKECGIEINRLQLKDAGTWECEMEEYKWGDWSSGPKHKHLFEAISVRNRFTPPVIVPKEEDVEEEEEEEEEGDNEIAPVHDEEGGEDEDDEEEDENSEEGNQEPGTEDHEHEEHNSEEEGVDEKEEEEESDLFPTSFNETDFSSNNSTDDDIIDVMWHNNLDGEELAGSSVGPIVGGVIAAIALVASLVVGALLWTKRKKSLAVITMSKLRESDDRSQANAFIEEAEYNATLPGGGGLC